MIYETNCRAMRQPMGEEYCRHVQSRMNGFAALAASLTGHAVRAMWQTRGGTATSANHCGLAKEELSGESSIAAR